MSRDHKKRLKRKRRWARLKRLNAKKKSGIKTPQASPEIPSPAA